MLGASVSDTDFGYSMSPETEGLAFQKLDQPITESATIRLKYRSDPKSGMTRNGALLIASKPTNKDSFKNRHGDRNESARRVRWRLGQRR